LSFQSGLELAYKHKPSKSINNKKRKEISRNQIKEIEIKENCNDKKRKTIKEKQ